MGNYYLERRAAFLGNLPDLGTMQLLAGLTNEVAAHFCGVSPETYRRWRRDRKPPLYAVKLLAIRSGYLPFPGWEGWLMVEGRLCPPGWSSVAFTPGEIQALPLKQAQVNALQSELRRLRRVHESLQASSSPNDAISFGVQRARHG